MKKTLKTITSGKIIIFIFLVCIGVTGFFNMKGLIDYYVYDKSPSSEWVPEMGDKLEADYSTVFWGKQQYVNLNGLCRNLLQQREMNGVTKLNNGWLAVVDNETTTDVLINNAQNVGKLNRYLEQNGVELLYVVVPDTISKYDSQLPKGVHDYTNEKLDAFVEQLKEEKVSYIDLREQMHEDGIDQYDMFYKTDHHWNVEGGFYAATQIIESAEEMLNVVVDGKIVDSKNYQKENYLQWHLGSRGQRVGRYFAGIDDFGIMYPKFTTEIVRDNDGLQGNFKEVFINTEALNNKNYASRYTYDKTYNTIGYKYINDEASIDRTLLVLSDSMGRVVIPYLSLAFNETDVIVYEEVNEELIQEKQPDIMVILLHPMNVFGDDYFKFKIRQE